MAVKECIAMILAGGRGERLGALTHYYSKPAVYFGGNNRIIDFTLRNCESSGIDTIGILSQCFRDDLYGHINSVYGDKPELKGVHVLPSSPDNLYKGTADAIYKNLKFIDRFAPKYVMVLASDHIYKMDYTKLISFHKEKCAAVTVASTHVSMEEASKFGILSTRESGRVVGFEEKPRRPKGNLASMGIYVFNWSSLKKHLLRDSKRDESNHDFGKDILPGILCSSESVYTYCFNSYWRDVGTVDSLWEANMDQITNPSYLELEENHWGSNAHRGDNIISSRAVVRQSIVSGYCSIFGKVEHSILSSSVTVGCGAEVVNSVVMPSAYIGNNVKIYNAVIGTRAIIMDNTVIGSDYGTDYFVDYKICARGISLVAPWLLVNENMVIRKNSQIYKDKMEKYNYETMKRMDILLQNRTHRTGVKAKTASAAIDTLR